MSKEKLVVTVPVTGAFGDKKGSPYLPVTPKEIAESAVEASKAGAAVAHIHVRDPETGAPSMEFKYYQEVVERIRGGSDMIINLTTGAGARFIPDGNEPIGAAPGSTLCIPEKRIEHVLRLKPEICSLDVGSMDFGPHVFVNYLPYTEQMAEQIRDAGVKPELEVFDMGHIQIAKHLIETGRVKEPPLFQLCMGIKWGIAATPENMMMMINALPDTSLWAAFGVGPTGYPMMTQSILLGGNVRIGMEDNLYLEKGVPAKSNRELVEKALKIMDLLGKEPATANEARNILHLN
jgi:uncharacterized protein (DUF849 family)